MSLLTPETVPVTIYKWDDAGAPTLDKSTNCMINIFKSCLVTGYGSKDGAGWSLAYDAASVKVLRPKAGVDIDYYLRLSSDNGVEVTAEVYSDMSSINTGDLKLQCAHPFSYGKRPTWAKWVLVASGSSFWFFNEAGGTKSGNYFFCGQVRSVSSGTSGVYIQHTGGSSGSGSDFRGITFTYTPDRSQYGRLWLPTGVSNHRLTSTFSGTSNYSADDVGAPLWLSAGNEVFICSGVLASACGSKSENFTGLSIVNNSISTEAMVFGSTATNSDNMYLSTQNWSY